jgi:phosphoglycerate dehydrogenase-like enzyme
MAARRPGKPVGAGASPPGAGAPAPESAHPRLAKDSPMTTHARPAIAVLDDWQGAARRFADWAAVEARADVRFFDDHLADPEAVVARLQAFDAVCVMRERTPLPRAVLERLARLRLVVSTGARNASIDVAAAAAQGVEVVHTGYASDPTIEFTWALILASCRHVAEENAAVRAGRWQHTVGTGLRGKTLGVLGLGRVGGAVARIGQAFGMRTIAWSPNMTPERAAGHGATAVTREALFAEGDIVTLHMVLSSKTRGLVGAADLARMKPTARLVNTSRGPLVDEAALLAALREGRIAGAAIDVFETEPLPPAHPLRTLPNVLATPHIGYVADDLYRTFFGDTVAALARWLDGR